MKKFKTFFIALMVLVTAVVATTILVGCNKVKTVYNDIAQEEDEEYALGVAHSSTTLLNQLNEFLASDGVLEFITTSIAFHTDLDNIDYSKAPIKASVLNDNTGATITMVTEATFAPYEYVLNSGDSQVNGVAGSDVDLMIKFCETYNYKLRVEQMDFDTIPTEVGTDKSGLMVAAAGLSVTEDRKKSISFSTPYTTTVQAIVSLEENNYKTLDELVGKTVAVQNGTTGEKLIKEYNEGKAKDKQINIQPFPAVTNAFLELKQLGVDALVIDSLVAKSLVVKG